MSNFSITIKSIALTTLAGALFFVSPANALVPNDTYFSQQWYLERVEAQEAWNLTTGKSSTIVAVLDTGVDLDHPDLATNIWTNPGEIAQDGIDNDGNGFIDDLHGWNFVENNSDTNPKMGANSSQDAINHGTLIAGVISAIGNNGKGVAGIGWNTKIMPVRVIASSGQGDAVEVIKGIDYAIENGADIINLSFTTFEKPTGLEEALKRAKQAGIVVVAAAGNKDGGGINMDTTSVYPACINGPAGENWVLGVAATNANDQKLDFSNYGSCVDLSAPGYQIFSTMNSAATSGDADLYGGGWAGTSLATPIVSGVAALVRSISPNFKRSDIIDILLKSSDPINNQNPTYYNQLGVGRVNADNAVRTAQASSARVIYATIAVASDVNGPPRVWLFNDVGTLITAFMAYDENFKGGVRLASADIDNDERSEIITVPGPGGGPHVKVFDANGYLMHSFFAFEESYRNGLIVAVGNVDSDEGKEIIVATDAGTTPRVRVFDRWGTLESEFLAFDSGFRGGAEVATGDMDHDGIDEIIVGSRGVGGPQVRIFDKRGNLKQQFMVFEDTYRNGVRIGTADVGGPDGDELLVARGGGETRLLHEIRTNGEPWNTIVTFAEDRNGPLAITSRETKKRNEIFVAGGKTGEFPRVNGFTPIGALISSFPVPQELGNSLRITAL